MKTIGILGGMSWESSAVYYQLINQAIRARLGAPHSAHLLLESFDFAEIAEPQERNDWETIRSLVAAGGMRLERGGADFWLVACNTVHAVTDTAEAHVGVPFLHIADAAGRVLAREGVGCVGLLGTRATLEGHFLDERLARHGVETLVPGTRARGAIHDVIFRDLVNGRRPREGRATLDAAIEGLCARGADAILLACTELRLLFDEKELFPRTGASAEERLFDTTALHAQAAADFALAPDAEALGTRGGSSGG